VDDTLIKHVKTYCPKAQGKELELRISLLKARDYAAGIRGRGESYWANNYAGHAHEIAGEFVFNTQESEARLDMALQLCRSLVKAAMTSEGLAATLEN